MEGRTRSGKRVIGLKYVPENGNGNKVTYPIKGSIVRREKPFKTEFTIWAPDGTWDVVWGRHPEDDLVEIPEGLVGA